MYQVVDFEEFTQQINTVASEQNTKIFNCTISGDIFKVATQSGIVLFDFSQIKSDEEVATFINTALKILKHNSYHQLVLFDEIGKEF